jgi:hypothetical protein
VNYEEALETALMLSDDAKALEAFLAEVPSYRERLLAQVELSRALGRDLSAVRPGSAARSRREQELLTLIAKLSNRQEPALAWRTRLAGLFTPRTIASGGLAAVLIALALVITQPAIDGTGPLTAEAVVIEGSVAEIGAEGVTISTADSAQLVKLSADTLLTDGFGNSLQPSDLNAGQTVVLKGNRSESGLVASQVEVKDRIFGTVVALSTDSLRLRSAQGEYVIAITGATEFEGAVRAGSYVEVKVLRLPDGSLRALEVEAEDDDEDESEGDDRRVEPRMSPAAATATPRPSSSSPGPDDRSAGEGDRDEPEVQDSDEDGSEDDEQEEEHEDEEDSEHEDESSEHEEEEDD